MNNFIKETIELKECHYDTINSLLIDVCDGLTNSYLKEVVMKTMMKRGFDFNNVSKETQVIQNTLSSMVLVHLDYVDDAFDNDNIKELMTYQLEKVEEKV